MTDNVHQPKHYTASSIECIDAIHAALGDEGFKAYCIGNAIKYQWRYRLKNGQEDLRKASVYLLWATTGNPAIKLGAVVPPRPDPVGNADEGNTAAPPSLSEIAAAEMRRRAEAGDDELPLRAAHPVSQEDSE